MVHGHFHNAEHRVLATRSRGASKYLFGQIVEDQEPCQALSERGLAQRHFPCFQWEGQRESIPEPPQGRESRVPAAAPKASGGNRALRWEGRGDRLGLRSWSSTDGSGSPYTLFTPRSELPLNFGEEPRGHCTVESVRKVEADEMWAERALESASWAQAPVLWWRVLVG